MNILDERPDHIIDLAQTTDDALLAGLRQMELPDPDSDVVPPLIELRSFEGLHAACMRWTVPVRVRATGNWGDYAFAHCCGPDVYLHGNVGHGVAEGMAGGIVRVTGHAGCGAGTAMTGGTLAIYGSAGPRCGAAMRGGSLFVRGDVGADTGAGALGGTIVVGGDAGRDLGDALNNVTVFLRGKAQSLAPGVTEAPLRKREQVRLGLLLMNASILGKASEFRRIIPIAKLRAEEESQGEIRPNWR